MGLVLAFAPFIVFAIIDRVVGSTEGLIAGAAVSLALVLRDALSGRSPKVLEIGSVVLFGGLAIYALVFGMNWPVIGVRLAVDSGLLVIVLLSLVLRKPFTMAYAREQVAQEHWDSPAFVRTNVVITAVWALAFVVLVIAEAVMLWVPAVPHQLGVLLIVAALVGAFKFTNIYPTIRKAASAPPTP